jgi:predicted  nucleic acid-binding Zn-ribbon protein
MKKVFQYLLIIVLFSIWGMIWQNKEPVQKAVTGAKESVSEMTGIGLPCAEPFEYAIGAVDSRFNLSAEDFLAEAQAGEKIWETQSGHDLFSYNPNAEFKLNLIFDERQLASNEADKLAKDLSQLELSQDKIGAQYDSLSASYKEALEKYNSDVAKYEKQLKAYNKDVEDWNASDKTSQSEFDALQKAKKNLAEFYEKLQKEQKEVNALAGKTNKLVTQEKKVVSQYNASISTYKEKYGGEREFEKGVYDGLEINIYQFKELADLRMTLVHELGHAIGLGHVENSKSIMYYLMGDQNMQNPTFSLEDMAALKMVCRF